MFFHLYVSPPSPSFYYNLKRKWQPTPVLLPGKLHGQRSLAGYSPWGRKESDTTERVSTQAEGTALFLAPTPYCLGERRGGG